MALDGWNGPLLSQIPCERACLSVGPFAFPSIHLSIPPKSWNCGKLSFSQLNHESGFKTKYVCKKNNIRPLIDLMMGAYEALRTEEHRFDSLSPHSTGFVLHLVDFLEKHIDDIGTAAYALHLRHRLQHHGIC